MSPPMSLLAKWRMGINEGRNHSEKDAKNGTKTRDPDQCAYMRQTKVEPVQKLSEVFWVT